MRQNRGGEYYAALYLASSKLKVARVCRRMSWGAEWEKAFARAQANRFRAQRLRRGGGEPPPAAALVAA